MSIVKITSENFEKEVLNSKKPVLLDFWASWCGPCLMLGPTVEEIAAENQNIIVGKIDIDSEQELARKFQIMGVPTLVVVKEKRIVESVVGVQSKEKILSMIK